MAHIRSYWSQTRLNGKPVERGTFYLISEFDDINPIATMGASIDEVLAKSEYARAATESELRRLRSTAHSNGNGNGNGAHAPAAPAPRTRMSANDVMQATSDLGNPAKAGEAIVRLFEDATGVDPRKTALKEFSERAEEWQQEHPEFYAHQGNIDLLTTYARRAVNGDWASIDKALLTTTFENLRARGLLFEGPAPAATPEPPATATTFPGGSPVQRTEYPRGMQGTGRRSTAFRAPQTAQPRTPKYSDDDIRKMPAAKQRELILANDPDYNEACERMYGRARASA